MTKVAAGDIREALRRHWPAGEYLVVDEAPDSADRGGSKLDILAVSYWRSRGLERDGVEIKVSVSDWRSELAKPAKADWWYHHCHRFWIAVPEKIVATVKKELPGPWGLLVLGDDGKIRAAKRAERHDPEPLPWTAAVGVMRAASGAGLNALARARDDGRSQGFKEGQARAEQERGESRLREQLDGLRAKVEAFRVETGVDLIRCYSAEDAQRVGALYTLCSGWANDPQRRATMLNSLAETLAGHVTQIREAATALVDP